MNSIYTRRSVRTFKDTPVEPEKITQLLKAAMQAPSAWNQQAWEFIVVQDKNTLEKLSTMTPNAKLIKGSAFSIVVLGNFQNMPNAPEKWQQDLGACTQNMLLEAVDLGLGAVWMGICPDVQKVNFVTELFNLPEHIAPYSIVTGGYPTTDDANKFSDRFDESKIHFEKY